MANRHDVQHITYALAEKKSDKDKAKCEPDWKTPFTILCWLGIAWMLLCSGLFVCLWRFFICVFGSRYSC